MIHSTMRMEKENQTHQVANLQLNHWANLVFSMTFYELSHVKQNSLLTEALSPFPSCVYHLVKTLRRYNIDKCWPVRL